VDEARRHTPSAPAQVSGGTPEAERRMSRRKLDDRPAAGRFPNGLELHIRPRTHHVELELAGELDLASAPRLKAAMAWLRARDHRTIVVDTRRLDFVDLAGYRALRSALDGSDGHRDPRTLYVVGAALARLQRHLAIATGTGSTALPA
jgi:anti-anti-sigma factor